MPAWQRCQFLVARSRMADGACLLRLASWHASSMSDTASPLSYAVSVWSFAYKSLRATGPRDPYASIAKGMRRMPVSISSLMSLRPHNVPGGSSFLLGGPVNFTLSLRWRFHFDSYCWHSGGETIGGTVHVTTSIDAIAQRARL